ncbi:MAG TPA: O-antigen ligase family protein [Candidatus Saccharimonadales bacterium]|nr:O-antigen ligase family protein [Candidatus Saccharimonadales bacterium]
MKASTLKFVTLDWSSKLSMLILLLMPFHAFLTVWGSSLFGHYITLRLWKEVLLVICAIGVLLLLALDHKIRSHTITRRLVWTIFAYMIFTVIWGLLALNQHDVTAKALGYGLIINLRFLVFFLVTWSAALRLGRLRKTWRGLVLVPAVIVVAIGLLQLLVLPHDFLRHFGYGPTTIPVAETVNHNAHYFRLFSTLRGANPLGAYLVIPITLVTVLMLRKTRNWLYATFLAAAVVVLFFTYSRSALVGTVLSVLVVFFLARLSSKAQRFALIGSAVFLIVLAGLGVALRDNTHVQNLLFHTQRNSSIKSTSDAGHFTALRSGWDDFMDHKLGRGPGTAGPASYYNTGHPERIAENYYIQIGQEVGVIGLGIFLLINAGVGYLLWLRRDDPLALSLFASLIGLSFINLLSHAWTDDTLAYIWWGLAGIAMVRLPGEPTEEK